MEHNTFLFVKELIQTSGSQVEYLAVSACETWLEQIILFISKKITINMLKLSVSSIVIGSWSYY